MKGCVFLALLLCAAISAQDLEIPAVPVVVTITTAEWGYVIQDGSTYPAITFTVDNNEGVDSYLYDIYQNDYPLYNGVSNKADFGDALEVTVVFPQLIACNGLEARIRVRDSYGNIIKSRKATRATACPAGSIDMCTRCVYSNGLPSTFAIAQTTCSSLGYTLIGDMEEPNYNNIYCLESAFMVYQLTEAWSDYSKTSGSWSYSNGNTELSGSVDVSTFDDSQADCSVYYLAAEDAEIPNLKATACSESKAVVCIKPTSFSEITSTTAYCITDQATFLS